MNRHLIYLSPTGLEGINCYDTGVGDNEPTFCFHIVCDSSLVFLVSLAFNG